jgi:hypothetical protein
MPRNRTYQIEETVVCSPCARTEPDFIGLSEAEDLTGLPEPLIAALIESRRVPGTTNGGQLCVGKPALLGWCRVYARVLSCVARKSRPQDGGYSAFELTCLYRRELTCLYRHAALSEAQHV